MHLHFVGNHNTETGHLVKMYLQIAKDKFNYLIVA